MCSMIITWHPDGDQLTFCKWLHFQWLSPVIDYDEEREMFPKKIPIYKWSTENDTMHDWNIFNRTYLNPSEIKFPFSGI